MSFVMLGLVVLALVLYLRTEDLKDALRKTEHQSAQQVTDLANAQKVLETFAATDALHVTLSTPAGRQPAANVVYQGSRGRLAMVAGNLPPLKPEQVYQLWLVTSAATPMPAGTFTADERGNASVFTAMPLNINAMGFEVTVEPKGGTLTPGSRPILTGRIAPGTRE